MTKAIILSDDELDTSENLILNISIDDLVDDMESKTKTWYKEVVDFLNKVCMSLGI